MSTSGNIWNALLIWKMIRWKKWLYLMVVSWQAFAIVQNLTCLQFHLQLPQPNAAWEAGSDWDREEFSLVNIGVFPSGTPGRVGNCGASHFREPPNSIVAMLFCSPVSFFSTSSMPIACFTDSGCTRIYCLKEIELIILRQMNLIN